jgi:esterase
MTILHYKQIGSGPNIVLLHGLFGNLDNLNMVTKYLAKQYTVTSMDVRNHGASFHQKNMHYSVLAHDVIYTLNALSIDKTMILGHSMGGKIAMQVALDFPDLIEKLIVADIAPVSYPPHHSRIIAGLLSLKLNEHNNRQSIDKALATYVSESSVRQFLLTNIVNDKGHFSFRCNLDNIAEGYPQIIKGLVKDKSFSGPTLFIKGGQSDYITAEHSAIIQQLFPLSSAKIIQQAGHWLHAEKTVVFNKIIGDFLLK